MADVSVEHARFAQLQQQQGQARRTHPAQSSPSAPASASSLEEDTDNAGDQAQETSRNVAAAKKKKEKEMRLIVRPMQKVLWTTGTIGAETVILPILAYPLWFLWKLAEIRKTRTKQDIGLPVWEDFIAPFGPIDYLQVIIGAVATVFIGVIIMGTLGLVVYFFLDPVEFFKSFQFLAEAFQFLFQ